MIMLLLMQVIGVILLSFGAECNRTKIMGGRDCESMKVDFKFMMSLMIWIHGKKYYQHYCGGTLVRGNVILTAAQCTNEKKSHVYAVEAYKLTKKEYYGHAIYISARIPHPEFNSSTLKNDIALMFLSESIYNDYDKVDYVDLSSVPYNHNNKYCRKYIIMGFGLTNRWESMKPKKLQCVEVNPITLRQCVNLFKKIKDQRKVGHGSMCTLGSETDDFLEGDIGGPLVCGKKQYGIISWGFQAKGRKFPSVYTSVHHYLSFIQKTNNISRNRSFGYTAYIHFTILLLTC